MPSQNNPRTAGVNYNDPRVIAAYAKLGAQRAASGGSTADKLQAALDKANTQNAARRDEINQSYLNLAQQQGGFGSAAKADISRVYGDRTGDIHQSAVSRGLSGTTVLPNLLAGNARDEAQELARVDESVALNGQNIELQRLGFQERINELGPDIMNLLPLLQQSGQASVSMPSYRPYSSSTRSGRRTAQRSPLDAPSIFPSLHGGQSTGSFGSTANNGAGFQVKKSSVKPGSTSIYGNNTLYKPPSTMGHEISHFNSNGTYRI
jgi:hypothetical protein